MVVSDMDGTLLDESGLVSKRNAAALKRAADSGAHVVIATGRPIWWLGPVIEAGFTGTAVCMNGAITYDVGAGEILSSSPLHPEPMQEFVGNLSVHDDRFAVAVERIGTDLAACWAEAHYDHPWADGVFQRVSRDQLLSLPVAKLLVRSGRDSRDLAQNARKAAGARVSVTYSSDDGLIEVAASGVNKGTALDRLAKQWDVDPSEVIAFGDMPNDLEMLTWAGHGVAMANAHAEVSAIANEIAGFHHEDGVALVLERWF